jgi:hypothetical protein
LVVNVPAGKWAYSAYDEAAGHLRRYSIRSLQAAAARSGLELTTWSYWGLPLVPTLVVRWLWLLGSHDKDETISAGFSPRKNVFNQLLGLVSRCEPTPQRFLGTSLMAVLQADGHSHGGDHHPERKTYAALDTAR